MIGGDTNVLVRYLYVIGRRNTRAGCEDMVTFDRPFNRQRSFVLL